MKPRSARVAGATAALILAVSMTAAACSRPGKPGSAAMAEPASGTVEPAAPVATAEPGVSGGQSADGASAGEREPQAAAQPGTAAVVAAPAEAVSPAEAVDLKPQKKKGKDAAASRAPPPAPSLAGHDRRLVSRPFDAIGPTDFAIGPLAQERERTGAEPVMAALAAALLRNALPDAELADLSMAARLYAEALASGPKVTEVRLGKPRAEPGGGLSVGIRLTGEGEDASRSPFATGFALLYPASDGAWVIEHLELDLAGLGTPRGEPVLWDPYANHEYRY